MRNTLFLFLTVLTIGLSSCADGNKRNSQHSDEHLDSIRKDSIRQAKIVEDSLALIAWGDTKFGMSKQDVMKSKAFGEENEKVEGTGTDYYRLNFEKSREFGRQNNLKEFSGIEATFKDNELTMVTLSSFYQSASYLQDLVSDCYILINQFTHKYGKPKELFTGNVSVSNFQGGEDNLPLAMYEIGNKIILVVIYEKDFEYYYRVHIYNESFPKNSHKLTREEKQQQEKNKKLYQEVKDNSF